MTRVSPLGVRPERALPLPGFVRCEGGPIVSDRDQAAADREVGPSDDELMSRFAVGDSRAFDILYLRHEGPLYGFCLGLLGDEDSAQDSFQETWVRVVEASPEYHPMGRFRSWVFTIARRVCLDRIRQQNKAGPLGADVVVGFADGCASPAEVVEHRDLASRLLRLLTDQQREVLALSRYSGFSYGEIAKMADRSEAAVKQLAYRAFETLRKSDLMGSE